MQFLTKKTLQWVPCPDEVWSGKLLDYYKNDLVLGCLSTEKYIQKLFDTFTLLKASAEDLPRFTYESCFSNFKPDYFRDIWIVKDDERSAFFYSLFHKIPEDDRFICIMYTEKRKCAQFASNDNIVDNFLEYYRGIDVQSLKEFNDKSRVYLNALDGLSTMLTAHFGENVMLDLTKTHLQHSKYILHYNQEKSC